MVARHSSSETAAARVKSFRFIRSGGILTCGGGAAAVGFSLLPSVPRSDAAAGGGVRMTRVGTILRRPFAGVSVLSLILCLATVGLWVRSYRYCDILEFVSAGDVRFALSSDRDRLFLFYGRNFD